MKIKIEKKCGRLRKVERVRFRQAVHCLRLNKKGWLRIVEAFTSIMLITGVLIILAESSRLETQIFSAQVYDSEHAILREIQLDSQLRSEILSVSSSSPQTEWNDFEANNLGSVKSRIESKTPSHLECVAKLCGIFEACVSNLSPAEKDIFVQSVFISANISGYNPKKLNLFCWNK